MREKGPLTITSVDLHDPAARDRLIAFLAPHETHTLFILGNLARNFPDSHLYIAVRNGECCGAAGYYGGPRALIPFATDPAVVRALTRHAAAIHPDLAFMNGIACVARHALDELQGIGYALVRDPRQVFMEMTIPGSALIRLMHGRGAEHCVLFTGHDNLAARNCYERMGFQTTDEYCVAELRRA